MVAALAGLAHRTPQVAAESPGASPPAPKVIAELPGASVQPAGAEANVAANVQRIAAALTAGKMSAADFRRDLKTLSRRLGG